MRRAATYLAIALLVFAVGLFAAIRPSIATAHEGGATITCSSVTFSYTDFANATNTVSEVVTVDGVTAHSGTFAFTGTGGSHSVAITVPADGESHTVIASSSWNTNGHQGSFRESAELECGNTTTTTTTEPPTTTTETTPPGPPCPDNPGGQPPNPPGGKDGHPGNDECVPDTPPAPPAPPLTIGVAPVPPGTTTSTTPIVTLPPTTTTVTTPEPEQGTSEATSEPETAPRPRKPRGLPPTAPPPCRPGAVETERCGVQGSG